MTDRTPLRSGLTSRHRRAIGLFAAVLALTVAADALPLRPSARRHRRFVPKPLRPSTFAAPGRRQFGLLRIRGGLALRSSHKNFGGMSAIRVASHGAHSHCVE